MELSKQFLKSQNVCILSKKSLELMIKFTLFEFDKNLKQTAKTFTLYICNNYDSFKGAVSVISKDPPCQDVNA